MSKAIFLANPSAIYDVDFSQIGENQIRLFFYSDMPSEDILLSGLQLINEHNGFVQTRREDYQYIYRRYNDNPLMIELCNDDVEYVEPEPIVEPEPYVPSEEEIAEQNRLDQIQELESQISALKNQLTSSDYKIIKEYEYSLVGKDPEYNMEELHQERQTIRNQINELEDEMQTLFQNKE